MVFPLFGFLFRKPSVPHYLHLLRTCENVAFKKLYSNPKVEVVTKKCRSFTSTGLAPMLLYFECVCSCVLYPEAHTQHLCVHLEPIPVHVRPHRSSSIHRPPQKHPATLHVSRKCVLLISDVFHESNCHDVLIFYQTSWISIMQVRE